MIQGHSSPIQWSDWSEFPPFSILRIQRTRIPMPLPAWASSIELVITALPNRVLVPLLVLIWMEIVLYLVKYRVRGGLYNSFSIEPTSSGTLALPTDCQLILSSSKSILSKWHFRTIRPIYDVIWSSSLNLQALHIERGTIIINIWSDSILVEEPLSLLPESLVILSLNWFLAIAFFKCKLEVD